MISVPADRFDECEGDLYAPGDHPLLLGQDMLHLAFGEHSIDVSWLPEHDPHGRYVITVYRGSWENQVFRDETADPLEVLRRLQLIADMLHAPTVLSSNSAPSIELKAAA